MTNIDSIVENAIKETKGTYSSNEDTNRTFPDLNIDSIDYVEIVLICEEKIGLDILNLDINWTLINTPKKLVNLIESLNKTK